MDFIREPEFWVAVSFFLILGVVAYFGLHKKIAAALEARAGMVLADYRRKQGDAAKEVEAIIRLAAKEAEELAAETRSSMAEHFERRMKLAEDKIARAETEALLEVRAAA